MNSVASGKATSAHTAGKANVWLSLSVPIAILAITSSLLGLFGDQTYAKETENWAGQAVGQDIANMVAYPVLLVLAFLAWRGSLAAFLAWTGLLAYSAYTFAIYAFSMHFNRLFLVYVAVFGLSVYALAGGLTSLIPLDLRARFSDRVPVRFTATLLILIGSMFYLLWLADVLGAIAADTTPAATVEAGLLTNPVHVLDMGLLLPAAITAGILLLKRRPSGFVLAPIVLAALIFIGVGIVAAMLVLGNRGAEAPVPVTLFVGLLTLVELATLVLFLRGIEDPLDSA